MPELPEVEVVRRSLNKYITGLKIDKICILDRNLRFKIPKNFKKIAEGEKIISIIRRGKYLIIKLQNNKIILIHLGMTGKLLIKKNNENSAIGTSFYYEIKFIKKHNHFLVNFNNSIVLIYNDVRKFGFLKITSLAKLRYDPHISLLGPEPLGAHFNYKYLKFKCKKSKKNIKNFLMDQKFVAGLGNIYVNEILYLSSVNPIKMTKNLTNKNFKKIIFYTKKTLNKAIRLGGASIRDFNSVSGKTGLYQENFAVYGRDGKSCKKRKCQGNIKRIYISNRSTFFCKKCQK